MLHSIGLVLTIELLGAYIPIFRSWSVAILFDKFSSPQEGFSYLFIMVLDHFPVLGFLIEVHCLLPNPFLLLHCSVLKRLLCWGLESENLILDMAFYRSVSSPLVLQDHTRLDLSVKTSVSCFSSQRRHMIIVWPSVSHQLGLVEPFDCLNVVMSGAQFAWTDLCNSRFHVGLSKINEIRMIKLDRAFVKFYCEKGLLFAYSLSSPVFSSHFFALMSET